MSIAGKVTAAPERNMHIRRELRARGRPRPPRPNLYMTEVVPCGQSAGAIEQGEQGWLLTWYGGGHSGNVVRRTVHVRVAAVVRLSCTHAAAERGLRAGSGDAWCGGLRGGKASGVPGLSRLAADKAHARELLLNAGLVRGNLLLVLRRAYFQTRGRSRDGRIMISQCARRRPSEHGEGDIAKSRSRNYEIRVV